MSSFDEDIPLTAQPPKICLNPRKKIEPEEIDPDTLILSHVHPHHRDKSKASCVAIPKFVQPRPRFPLFLIWSPDQLYFELDGEPITLRLWICNGSTRTIYVHCSGLWNEVARLGAAWYTYPRTRFLLAPGLKSYLFIKATPRSTSPIKCVCMCLQLAASHLRDNVTGYFNVPVVAKFLNYEAPLSETGYEEESHVLE